MASLSLDFFFFFFWLVSDPGAPGTHERTPSIYCGGPYVGTIGAATHSMGGRGNLVALLAPVNRPGRLIDFFEALE